jgi:uncharacterized alkaline shock family protein YloU
VSKGAKPPSPDPAVTGTGRVVIAESAIADLVGWTVLECYGVVGMASPNLARGVGRLLSRDRLHQGITIDQTPDRLKIDLFIVVEYGLNVAEVAGNVRAQVAYHVARITGRAVDQLHIHVQGVRFGDH